MNKCRLCGDKEATTYSPYAIAYGDVSKEPFDCCEDCLNRDSKTTTYFDVF